MKNPTKPQVHPESIITPQTATAQLGLDTFFARHPDIDAQDKPTILSAAIRLVGWYRLDDAGRAKNADARYLTSMAKNEIYMETNHKPYQRREMATIFDELAMRAGQPRWTFPVDKRGNIVIKPYTCYA